MAIGNLQLMQEFSPTLAQGTAKLLNQLKTQDYKQTRVNMVRGEKI